MLSGIFFLKYYIIFIIVKIDITFLEVLLSIIIIEVMGFELMFLY